MRKGSNWRDSPLASRETLRGQQLISCKCIYCLTTFQPVLLLSLSLNQTELLIALEHEFQVAQFLSGSKSKASSE